MHMIRVVKICNSTESFSKLDRKFSIEILCQRSTDIVWVCIHHISPTSQELVYPREKRPQLEHTLWLGFGICMDDYS